jgi:hypothetical protein
MAAYRSISPTCYALVAQLFQCVQPLHGDTARAPTTITPVAVARRSDYVDTRLADAELTDNL